MKQEYDKLEVAVIILLTVIMLVSLTGCTITKIRELIDLREIQKSIIPLQNIVGRLLRPDEEFISEENYLYFRDLADVIKGLVIKVENYSSGAASTRDTYLSQASVRLSESNARLSEVMTTLTVIGSIMLPLSLVAGIAGMNVGSDFDFTQIMSVMVIFASTMIIYFYRKGWIGPQK